MGFWFFKDLSPPHRREHVLPDGTFELIIDLRDEPRHVFDRENSRRDQTLRRGWISGTHSQYIVIDALPESSMIGVHFKPGGAYAILGLPANAVRDQVVELDAIWGSSALDLRDPLLAAPGAEMKFRALERFLLHRLSAGASESTQQRGVFWARDLFVRDSEPRKIGAVAEQLGISHKHFIDQFRRHVGLPPKLFCRIQRFQQVLGQVAARQTVEWADVAYSCGYFDQAPFRPRFPRLFRTESFGLRPGTAGISEFRPGRRGEVNFFQYHQAALGQTAQMSNQTTSSI